MPVVIVAVLPVKPESADSAREILTKAVAAVHDEPGCELYALHETDGKFIFVEQWADGDALKAHSSTPTMAAMFSDIGPHLDGAPEIIMATPVPAGDPAKGRLVR